MSDEYSLKRNTHPVLLDGVRYTLHELDGVGRDLHMVTRSKSIVYEDGKAVSLTAVPGMQAELVSLCLVDESGKRVPLVTIQGWPGRVVSALARKCEELSALTDGAQVAAGNGSAASVGNGSASPST